MGATIRLFTAVDLDAASTRRAVDLVSRARALRSAPAAAWVRPENFHVTLAFIGDVDRGVVPAASEALRVASAGRSVELRLGPIGAFPSRDEARVIFLAIDDPRGALAAMQASLIEGLASLGVASDGRPYVPHLTIARCGAPTSLTRWCNALGSADLGPCHGVESVLYESAGRATGRVYRALARYELSHQR